MPQNLRSYILTFTLVAIVLVTFAFPVSAQRKELEQQYEEILRMPAGEAQTRAFENLVFSIDRRGRLGPAPVEDLAWIYLNNEQLDRAIGLLNTLESRNSTDYLLMFTMAKRIWEQRQDFATTQRLLNKAVTNVQLGRRVPPKEAYDAAYYAETYEILGMIEYYFASLYMSQNDYRKADEHISRAISYRTDPRDYTLLSGILLQKGRIKARECLGTAMFAIYRGEIPEARQTFKSAYDSLEWDVHKLDDYIEEFQNLYISNDANIILRAPERTPVRELPTLDLSLAMGMDGMALVFWDENMAPWDLKGAQSLFDLMRQKNIPNMFVYAGDDYGEGAAKLRQQRYSFMGIDVADLEVLRAFQVVKTPTVLVIGPEGRILYRMEGPNQHMDKLFDKVWEAHIKSVSGSYKGR